MSTNENKKNKIENLNVDNRDVEFTIKSGEIISTEKSTTPSVQGKPGYVEQEVWLKTEDGAEIMSKIQTKDQSDTLPLREGHNVTIVEIYHGKMPAAYPAFVINHTTKSEHVVLNKHSTVIPLYFRVSMKGLLIGMISFPLLVYLWNLAQSSQGNVGAYIMMGLVSFAWFVLYSVWALPRLPKEHQKIADRIVFHIKEQLKLAEKGV